MARDKYTYELTCDQCGATGTAHGSDDDNGPNFSIDSLTNDFGTRGNTRNPWGVDFTHKRCSGKVTSTMICE